MSSNENKDKDHEPDEYKLISTLVDTSLDTTMISKYKLCYTILRQLDMFDESGRLLQDLKPYKPIKKRYPDDK